jgi:hypothetical protein
MPIHHGGDSCCPTYTCGKSYCTTLLVPKGNSAVNCTVNAEIAAVKLNFLSSQYHNTSAIFFTPEHLNLTH